MNFAPLPACFSFGRISPRPGRALALGLVAAFASVAARAISSAPAGVTETGAPSFAVMGPEALGLSEALVDLDLLPDGRIVAVTQHELSFGDGVRWEAYRSEDENAPVLGLVAVDHDGNIYSGGRGGFSRIELTTGARWKTTPAGKLPPEAVSQEAALIKVATIGDQWYWYGETEAIVSWRPGRPSGLVGRARVIDRIFNLDDALFVSDESSGRLFRMKPDGTEEQVLGSADAVSEGVVCSIPFQPGRLLVGTISAGLKIFDGKNFQAFGRPGVLNDGHRITDLCQAGGGFFAAAIDTVGIVFFDREGNIVQVLGRTLDHRLARAQRLKYAPNGVLWALLNDSIARVEFPSPVSHFGSMLSSGLAFAQPLRHEGHLWVLADGRATQGVYDAGGRLERFQDNTPPGSYLFTLAEVDGQLFATNDRGIYVFEKNDWRLVIPEILNARLGMGAGRPGEIFYVARGEYGVITRSGNDYHARRIPLPQLEDSYNAVTDAAGTGWVELGTSLVGRLDPAGGEPAMQIFGTADGLANGWIEIYLLDGRPRFHLGYRLYYFDEATRKFIEDRGLLARLPQLAQAGGRPTTDPFGRLWYTFNGTVQVIDRSPGGNDRPVALPFTNYAPSNYTIEDNGVVWMFERRKLARLDLRLPMPPESSIKALITSVELPGSTRQFFTPVTSLAPLPYSDNSLVVHFAAPANPFGLPITFEVQLEGAGNQWVSTGATGSASFNRLKEGDYTFRVRPVIGRTTRGAEARLPFTVEPPWFRTRLAWVVYILGTIGLLTFALWLTSYLQRRENERLEKIVAERTGELHATNAQLGRQIEETTEKSTALAASEERYRSLNAELEERVRKRTAELEHVHRQLVDASRQAGMAEVATGVLHNVGNVLNSVNVSSTVIASGVKQSKSESLAKIAALLKEHEADLALFLTQDPKGKRVPELIDTLARHLAEERTRLLAEINSLQRNVDHVKEIVSRQQAYATVVAIVEPLEAHVLLEESLFMSTSVLSRPDLTVVRDFQPVPRILVEKGKVLQILINFIRNARHACDDSYRPDKLITVTVEPGRPGFVRLSVRDNGVGIPAENLTRIFGQGFTTRAYGHGFGLHSSALAAKELKGALTVHSDGPGLGAVFTLELPVAETATGTPATAGLQLAGRA